MELTFGFLVLSALVCAGRALANPRPAVALSRQPSPGSSTGNGRLIASRHAGAESAKWRARMLPACLCIIGGALGFRFAGAPGLIAGACCGAGTLGVLERRKRRARAEELDGQLAELVESWALGIRSGLSIHQALEFAANDVEPPLSELLAELLAAQRIGVPFETALQQIQQAVGTADAKLLVLVVSIHNRSGGNLAQALEEVAATIRHRVASRRDLRALTAQGRTSAVILGSLPLVFFLFLSVTSDSHLDEVYRSTAGATMVSGGFVLEVLAYLWIRRLLRVEL